jgi:hypothetical protein
LNVPQVLGSDRQEPNSRYWLDQDLIFLDAPHNEEATNGDDDDDDDDDDDYLVNGSKT